MAGNLPRKLQVRQAQERQMRARLRAETGQYGPPCRPGPKQRERSKEAA